MADSVTSPSYHLVQSQRSRISRLVPVRCARVLTVSVRSRNKPGRKPIDEPEASDRRRTQNRLAQRNFRDKRQQKLFDTQQELENNKVAYREDIMDRERDLEAMRIKYKNMQRAMNKCEQRNKVLEQRNKALEQEQIILKTHINHHMRQNMSQNMPQMAYGQQQMPPLDTANVTINRTGSLITPPDDEEFYSMIQGFP